MKYLTAAQRGNIDLPKQSDTRGLTQNKLDNITDELNNKPRKRLLWHTPLEVYIWLV